MVAKKLKASLIKVFCLVLAVVLALAAAGCKGSSKKKNSKKTGKKNSIVASAIDETNSSDSSGIMDDEDEDEQPELIDDSVPKEELEIEELTVYNNKPIAPFRGVNYIYHPFNYLSDSFGREYTDEMRKLELTRIQKCNRKFCVLTTVRLYRGTPKNNDLILIVRICSNFIGFAEIWLRQIRKLVFLLPGILKA